MCGIVGIYSFRGQHSGGLASALDTLRHRGPDDRQSWVSTCKRYALGHTRLAIIDPAGGVQPMRGPRGQMAVVNGEFYDYRGLRSDLEAQGHPFQTRSDSEILIPLLAKYGARAFEFLRGEFAFIHIDPNTGELLAGRDRYGVKPLYYAIDDSKLLLASEAKALFAMGVPATWNENAIFDGLTSFAVDPRRSLFREIRQVPPGHFLKVDASGAELYPYWDLDYNHTESDPSRLSDREFIEEYRELFSDAVKTRLVADVPVAVYLSGGLDSASVLGVASRLAQRELTAFTIGFADAAYDETPQAQEMADHVGATVHRIDVSQRDLVDNFDRAIWNSETFFSNTHGVAKYLLSRLVRQQGFKTVLTGEGADEHLAGYPHFRQDDLADRFPDPDARRQAMQALAERNAISAGLLISNERVNVPPFEQCLGFVPAFFEGRAKGIDQVRRFFSPRLAESRGRWHGVEQFLERIDFRAIRGANRLHQSMYLWTKSIFPNYLLNVLGDRMEMAHSVEARLPFVDHRLTEFLCRVPSRLKVHGDTEKYIHREAVKDAITDTIYRRQKHPFLAPPAGLDLDGPLMGYFREVVFDRSFEDLGMLNTDAIRATVQALPTPPRYGSNSTLY